MNNDITRNIMKLVTAFLVMYFINLGYTFIKNNVSGFLNKGITITYTTVVMAIFGLLLGLEFFAKERKKTGRFKLNKSRLLCFSLPIILIVILFYGINILMYFNQSINLYLKVPKLISFIKSTNSLNILSILIGYTIITSFSKDD